MNNRFLVKNGATLTDYSNKLGKSTPADITLNYQVGDYLYIGARLPFNHTYFEIERAADPAPVASTTTIEYWSGTNWTTVVDLMDSTEGLLTSGHIEFTPDKEEWWMMWDTNHNSQNIPDLSGVTIYDKYWLRISFADTLDPSIKLNYLGNLFSSDTDLSIEYPDLVRTDVKASFLAGKTDWNDQHKRASDVLIKDLIDMGIIYERGQILNWRDYTDCAIHKVAEIIFTSFGDSYRDNSVDARREYQQRLSKRVHRVDLNKNAIETPNESFNTTGWLSR